MCVELLYIHLLFPTVADFGLVEDLFKVGLGIDIGIYPTLSVCYWEYASSL